LGMWMMGRHGEGDRRSTQRNVPRRIVENGARE
jgi:hypothetical protein